MLAGRSGGVSECGRRGGAAAEPGLVEESIFTWGAPPLKFGPGAVDEIGFDMAQYGVRRVISCLAP